MENHGLMEKLDPIMRRMGVWGCDMSMRRVWGVLVRGCVRFLLSAGDSI